ncbi:MAG: hypothetical protein WC445_01175 [Patescibacteria group bacterium]
MDYIKKLLKSKTVWAGIVAVVTGFGLFMTGEQELSEFLFGASGVLSIILRSMTNQPIENK